MIDKPKHKNSPNRRRKFLLMIVLPTVALIVGFMVLSPQIDAWLATDPFTPHCHFEEDRLFATDNPMKIGSLNSGQYESINDYDANIYFNWSPDGKRLVNKSVLEIEDGRIAIDYGDKFIAQGGMGYWVWTPDGRYLIYGDGNNWGNHFEIYDFESQVFLKEFSIYIPESWDISGLIFPIPSPNSRYVRLIHSGNLDFQDKIIDLFSKNEIPLPDFDVNNLYQWRWSGDGNGIYYLYEHQILYFDIANQSIIPIADLESKESNNNLFENLENDGTFDTPYLLFDSTHTPFILNTFTHKTEIVDDEPIELVDWLSNDEAFIYFRNNKNADSMLYIYNMRQSQALPLLADAVVGSRTQLSLSGRYLIFAFVPSNKYPEPIVGIGVRHQVYNIHTQTIMQDLEIWTPTNPQWLEIDGKDYLVVSKPQPQNKQYLTYLWNPDTNQWCKIGYTGERISFQPRG